MATRKELLERKRELLLQRKAALEQQQYSTPERDEAPFQYQEGDLLGNIGRGIGNIPSDAASVVGNLASAVANPVDTISAIGNLAWELPGEIGKRLGADFEGGDTAGAMLDELKSAYIDNPGETLTERPVQSAMDIASIVFPAAKGVGAVGKAVGMGGKVAGLGEKALSLNPLTLGGKAVKGTARRTSNLVEKLVPEIAGFPTGVEAGAFREAFKAGAQGIGSKHLTEFKAATRGLHAAEDLANSMLKASGGILDDAAEEYTRLAPSLKLKDAASPLDLDLIRTDMFDTLRQWGVRPVFRKSGDDWLLLRDKSGKVSLDWRKSKLRPSKSQRATIDNLVKYVDEVIGEGDASIRTIDTLKQGLDTLIKPNVTENNKYANSVATSIRAKIRKQLGEKVDGYDELTKGYEEAISFNRELQQALGTGGNLEPMINKLTSILKDRPSASRGLRLVEAMEEKSGIPFRSIVAGLNTEPIAPGGLIGRSAGASLLGGGILVNPGLLAWLPFTSPRVMGNLFAAMGVGSRGVKRLSDFLKNIHDKLPNGAITEGMTIGEVMQNYDIGGN